MEDHVQLRFKAKEAMAIASGREAAGNFAEASEAYTLAADICCAAKAKALAAHSDARPMKDAEVWHRALFLCIQSFCASNVAPGVLPRESDSNAPAEQTVRWSAVALPLAAAGSGGSSSSVLHTPTPSPALV